MLETVPTLSTEDHTSKTFKVKWTEAPGNKDGYVVECNCNDASGQCRNHSSSLLANNATEYECSNLTEGSNYSAHAITFRVGFSNVSKSVTTQTSKILMFALW